MTRSAALSPLPEHVCLAPPRNVQTALTPGSFCVHPDRSTGDKRLRSSPPLPGGKGRSTKSINSFLCYPTGGCNPPLRLRDVQDRFLDGNGPRRIIRPWLARGPQNIFLPDLIFMIRYGSKNHDSFVAKCDHRVDPCSPPRWNVAGQNRSDGQHQCNTDEGEWIVRTHSKEQAGENARGSESGQ